jgi:hypothetical protein
MRGLWEYSVRRRKEGMYYSSSEEIHGEGWKGHVTTDTIISQICHFKELTLTDWEDSLTLKKYSYLFIK